MTVNLDIVKFFQAFIRQMAAVGGTNLPKTISASLGANLGRRYAQQGIPDWKEALPRMIEAMGGNLDVVECGGEVSLKIRYLGGFCPIGGNLTPTHFESVTESVCKPYITGFLRALQVKLGHPPAIQRCIVRDGGTACELRVNLPL